jgi:hypothetical protein
VEVVIRTINMGHHFTQGTADSNEVWVELTARSGGRVLARSGALDDGDRGRVDAHAHFLNVLMLDRYGNPIDRRNPQDIFTALYDHQIPPGAAQVVHYRLTLPADLRDSVELVVRVRYRKFDYTYMAIVHGKGQVPPLPVVDLCSDRVVLSVLGGPDPAALHGRTEGARPPSVRFADVTAKAGIRFVYVNGASGKKLLPETMGSGVAFLDFDNDGHQDLLFVNSRPWPGTAGASRQAPTLALYRNKGDGTFEGVTQACGLDVTL